MAVVYQEEPLIDTFEKTDHCVYCHESIEEWKPFGQFYYFLDDNETEGYFEEDSIFGADFGWRSALMVLNKKVLAVDTDSGYELTSISYCPKCGRKL